MPIGIAAFAALTKLLQTYTEQRRGQLKTQGLQELKTKFLDSLVKGDSSKYYLDRSKLPIFHEWSDVYALQGPDWDSAITALTADLKEKGIHIDDKAKEAEAEYTKKHQEIQRQMNYIKEEHKPPVMLSNVAKKLKLAGQAALAVAAMSNMIPGPGAPSSSEGGQK
ncbi:unnamed protein product, partial [Hymenolepis diminuta]